MKVYHVGQECHLHQIEILLSLQYLFGIRIHKVIHQFLLNLMDWSWYHFVSCSSSMFDEGSGGQDFLSRSHFMNQNPFFDLCVQ